MSHLPVPAAPGKNTAFEARFRLVGIFILVAGLLSAAFVYRAAVAPEVELYLMPPGYTKGYQNSMEVMGGKANIVITEFREWLGSLWHGKRLAYTLVVLSAGACAACFYLGDFLSYPLPPRDQRRHER